MNKLELVGNISDDIRGSEKCVKITVAVKNHYKDADGTYGTQFIPVTVWNQSAEYLKKYAVKGSMIAVTGNICNNNWTDKDGNKHYDLAVNAEEVSILARGNFAE